MGAHDRSDLLDQYLQVLHLLTEVRTRFPSDDAPEVLVVTKQLERLEIQIRAISPPDTDRPMSSSMHDDDLELYAAGKLESEKILLLESHLSVCESCRERLSHCVSRPDGEAAKPDPKSDHSWT